MQRLFAPRAIAIIGASSDAAKFSGRPIAYLRKLGYAGAVYPINPAVAEIQGYRCYADMRDVPGPVDAVLLARPAVDVVGEVEKCLALGVRAFVVLSGGFAETGPAGAAIQARMAELCRAAGAVLVGPNGTGMFVAAPRAIMSFMSNLDNELEQAAAAGLATPPSVALISGSGSIAAMIYQGRGHVFNAVVSTGNEAVTTTTDFIDFVLQDPGTRGVAAYVEGIRDGAAFLAMARRAEALGKTVALLKVGRGTGAAEILASHTGALLNDDVVVDAACRRHHVLRVDSIEELKAAAVLLQADVTRVTGTGVGVATPSGGTAVLLTDLMNAAGIELPPLTESTRAALAAAVPGAHPANPMDVTGFGADSASFGKVLAIMLADPNLDVLITPLGGAVGKIGLERAELVVALSRTTHKVIMPIWQSTTRDQPGYDLLVAQGLPVFTDYEVACKVLARLLLLQRRRRAATQMPRGSSATRAPVSGALAVAVSGLRRGPGAVLDEAVSKGILQAAGIAIPRAVRLPDTSAVAPPDFPFPAVLKVVSGDLLHKSAVGGVAVVRTPDALPARLALMASVVAQQAPQARLDGYLLEEMVLGGFELLVGVQRDPLFGPTITLGIGGVFANGFANAATALLPLDANAAADLVQQFSPYIAAGPWGAPLVNLLQQVDAIVAAFGARLDLLEINPVKLVQGETGPVIVALDGVIGVSD